MELRQISLVKGSERYVFRYSPGNEPQIIDSFVDMADDIDSDFDWFDAAVLSYQMGKQMTRQMDKTIEQIQSKG
jgi:hypothetical protein